MNSNKTEKKSKRVITIQKNKNAKKQPRPVLYSQYVKPKPISPNSEKINNRNVKSRLLSLYKHAYIDWENIHFVRRGLKVKDDYRFGLKLAEPIWTNYISKMKKLAPNGLDAYFTRVNGELKLFSILNLDVVLGVALGILDPDTNDYSRVRFERIERDRIIEILDNTRLYQSRKPYIQYLLSLQSSNFEMYEIIESIDYYGMSPRKRQSFLFTLEKSNGVSGLFVVESLDENTGTHIFKIDSLDSIDYEISKAKLRNYFQGNVCNKRQKLYDENALQYYLLNKISSLHHTEFDTWRNSIKMKLKE